ncbi:peptidylprolyl isomerase [Pollutimonas bauzanensis]|uniref:Peptidylprolyl isomerase n=1 Tax=Pollutimonas bauzanensis TaxID=658167 RepID=A0A1M5RFM2_9BURK|nr:peptidylprolyl isomerase [Pollutimonas bauzanensis]SHH24799.1 peptidylprolyl isomerase [Pollutimonas bauzanensis]
MTTVLRPDDRPRTRLRGSTLYRALRSGAALAVFSCLTALAMAAAASPAARQVEKPSRQAGKVPGAAQARDDGSPPVARMGSATITQAELQDMLQQIPPTQRMQLAARREALEDLLWQRLAERYLVRDARKANWAQQPQVKAQIDAAARELSDRIVAATYLQQQAKVPDAYPSQDELKAAYAKLAPPPSAPATYALAQIFLKRPAPGDSDSTKAMEALRAQAKALAAQARAAGGDFAQLAKAHSQDAASAAQGGALSPQPQPLARMRPAAAKAAGTLNVGEVSDPVETAQGLFIFKLLDKQVERPIPLAELEPMLRQAMRADLARRNERAYLESIAARGDMHVDDAALAAAVERLP